MVESVPAQWSHDAHDRKPIYTTRAAAQRACQAINRRPKAEAVTAYGCSHCGFFHIGRKR